MKPIPLLDYVGNPIFCTLFALLLFLQWKWPLRRRHFSVLRRLVRNFVMSVPAFVILHDTKDGHLPDSPNPLLLRYGL